MKDELPEQLLTRTETAKRLRVSVATLGRLCEDGLPHIKLGKRVLFRSSSVDKFIADLETTKGE